jgi:IS30 family transposase
MLVKMVERVSKNMIIAYVPYKHAEVVKDAVIKFLQSEKKHLHTVTFDNGKGFSYHAQVRMVLGDDSYFFILYSL